jgi:hypothetical protein
MDTENSITTTKARRRSRCQHCGELYQPVSVLACCPTCMKICLRLDALLGRAATSIPEHVRFVSTLTTEIVTHPDSLTSRAVCTFMAMFEPHRDPVQVQVPSVPLDRQIAAMTRARAVVDEMLADLQQQRREERAAPPVFRIVQNN